MEQSFQARTEPDRSLREDGIQHQFENLEGELAALTDALDVHAKAIESVLRGSDPPQSFEETLARLSDAAGSTTASRVRDRTEQVTLIRHKLESLTARIDF